MNIIEKFKAEHPDIYGAIVSEERTRVTAHLRFGEKFHARDLADKAIADGTSASDPDLQQKYFERALRWRAQEDRQEESDAAAEAIRGAQSPGHGGGSDLGDRMADAMKLPPDPGPKVRSTNHA